MFVTAIAAIKFSVGAAPIKRALGVRNKGSFRYDANSTIPLLSQNAKHATGNFLSDFRLLDEES